MINSIKILLAMTAMITMSGSVLADGSQGCAEASDASRRETLLAIQMLQVDLLSHASATETLERWCASQGLADPAVVTAERVRDRVSPAAPSTREQLQVGPQTRLGYRHVRLKCGGRVLSEADNWYVPERLTPAMNRTLDRTDTPFGKVVKPLGFSRHTLSSTLLWDGAADSGALPYFLFEHRALLKADDGSPLSLLTERYTRHVLKHSVSAGKRAGH